MNIYIYIHAYIHTYVYKYALYASYANKHT